MNFIFKFIVLKLIVIALLKKASYASNNNLSNSFEEIDYEVFKKTSLFKQLYSRDELLEVISTKKKFFLEVYSSTCSHCIKLAPILEEIIEEFNKINENNKNKEDDNEYNFYRLEGSSPSVYRNVLTVNKFPELLIYDNERFYKYSSIPTKEFIFNWVSHTYNFNPINLNDLTVSFENKYNNTQLNYFDNYLLDNKINKVSINKEIPFLIGYFSSEISLLQYIKLSKLNRSIILQCFYFTEKKKLKDFIKEIQTEYQNVELNLNTSNFIISFNNILGFKVFDELDQFNQLENYTKDLNNTISLSLDNYERKEYNELNINKFNMDIYIKRKYNEYSENKEIYLSIDDYYLFLLQDKYKNFLLKYLIPSYIDYNTINEYFLNEIKRDYIIFSYSNIKEKTYCKDIIKKLIFTNKIINFKVVLYDSKVNNNFLNSVEIEDIFEMIYYSSDLIKNKRLDLTNYPKINDIIIFVNSFLYYDNLNIEKHNVELYNSNTNNQHYIKSNDPHQRHQDNINTVNELLANNDLYVDGTKYSKSPIIVNNLNEETSESLHYISKNNSELVILEKENNNNKKTSGILKSSRPMQLPTSQEEEHENEIDKLKKEKYYNNEEFHIKDNILKNKTKVIYVQNFAYAPYFVYLIFYSLLFLFFYTKISLGNIDKLN